MIDIVVSPCEQCKKVDLELTDISSGLLLKVKVKVKNLCVGKNVAIGVVICQEKLVGTPPVLKYEVISTQVSQMKVTGTPGQKCADVTKEFIFAIPTVCGTEDKKFKAFAVANYIFDNSNCCCKE